MSKSQGILRRFNEAGITEFVRRIETLRAGGAAEIDDDFVTDANLTVPIVPEVQLERPSFKTKRDAGEYLSERTRAARAAYGDDDRGLWTWLSAWHFDAVCPVLENGQRKVLATCNYVFGFSNSQNTKRHLLFTATSIYEIAPASELLLETPVTKLTQVVQDVCTRVVLSRLPGIYPLLDLLYRDPLTGKPKKGIVDPRVAKPGDLRHRMTARIRQLEVTHDLTNLTAEQLLNLLGDEFRQWAVAVAQPQPAVTRRSQPATQQSPAAPTPPSP